MDHVPNARERYKNKIINIYALYVNNRWMNAHITTILE